MWILWDIECNLYIAFESESSVLTGKEPYLFFCVQQPLFLKLSDTPQQLEPYSLNFIMKVDIMLCVPTLQLFPYRVHGKIFHYFKDFPTIVLSFINRTLEYLLG